MKYRSTLFYAGCTLFAVLVGISLERAAAMSDGDVADGILAHFDSENPVVIQNLTNIIWHPSNYYYSSVYDNQFPGSKEAAHDFQTEVTASGQDLLRSGGATNRSSVDMTVIFAPEGEKPNMSDTTLKDSAEVDDSNLRRLWGGEFPQGIRFGIPLSTDTPDKYDGLSQDLTIAFSELANDSGSPKSLDVMCSVKIAYVYSGEAMIDVRTATILRANIYSNDYLYWLSKKSKDISVPAAALNHCFLTSIGIPRPSTYHELAPVYIAAKKILECARNHHIDDAYKKTADTRRIAQEILRACGA